MTAIFNPAPNRIMSPIKTLAACLLAAFALSACSIENESSQTTQAAPAASNASASTPATVADNTLPTAEAAAKIEFEFTPATDKQIVYFNSESQAVSEATNGGYYREIIGQTADGRIVAQDFYQDIGKPQTQPFILQKGADVRDFSSDTMDSKGVWFRPDGSLFQVQDFRAGKATGPAWVFENEQVIASVHDEPSRIDFYQNGKSIAIWLIDGKDKSINMTYFRADGSKALQMTLKADGNLAKPAQAWRATGEAVPPENVREEIEPMIQRAAQIFTRISQDNGFVMGNAVQASQAQ